MPLVLLCGRPCVGKTAFARELQAHFQRRAVARAAVAAAACTGASSSSSSSQIGADAVGGAALAAAAVAVHLVNDESLGIDKGDAMQSECRKETSLSPHARWLYRHSLPSLPLPSPPAAAAEKNARAALKSAIERLLVGNTLVIADGLNYIKGFRYELHCIVRAAGTRMCLVWVGPEGGLADARARNEGRRRAAATAASDEATDAYGASRCAPYGDAALAELWARFEAPDERNRWDQPLVRVAGLPPPLADASGGGGGGGGAAGAAASSGPFFTSRYDLSGVYSSAELSAASAAGTPVGLPSSSEALDASTARLGLTTSFGAVLHGGGRVTGLGVDAESDVANLRDLEGFETGPASASGAGGAGGGGGGGGGGLSGAREQQTTGGTRTPQLASSPSRPAGGSSFRKGQPAGSSSFRKGVPAGGGSAAAAAGVSATATTAAATSTGIPEQPLDGEAPLPSAPAATLVLAWPDAVEAVAALVGEAASLDSAAAGATTPRALIPTMATQHVAIPANYIFEVDAVTSAVVSHISAALLAAAAASSGAGGGGGGGGGGGEDSSDVPVALPAPDAEIVITLPPSTSAAALRRLQRTFVKLATDPVLVAIARGPEADGPAPAGGEGGRGGQGRGGGPQQGLATGSALRRKFAEYLTAAVRGGGGV
jgi:hypothetical protein